MLTSAGPFRDALLDLFERYDAGTLDQDTLRVAAAVLGVMERNGHDAYTAEQIAVRVEFMAALGVDLVAVIGASRRTADTARRATGRA